MIKHFADKIVGVANTMAAGGTYGCVNDFDAYQPDFEDARETDPNILAVLNAAKDPKLKPPKKLRYGWRNLKKFYEKAGGFGPEKWKDRATLEGVMLNGKKIPQPGTPGSTGIDWCGVFATYCWIEAGVPGVRWGWPDTVGPWVSKSFGTKGIGRGDIGYIKHKDHQFIITDFTGPITDPNTFAKVVSGNSDYQGIKKESFAMRDIVAYVTYNPFVWMIETAATEIRAEAEELWGRVTADE